ncbi:diketogulonate reductase-like aldo/keto reductase [Catenuloplanes nepalensis]|uniref:Diketogulonate reductase-like aldo/keto reductase n=1 Tax=Catenuloplanes nepalensis TaxID=587533 RepID=A0ABT9MRV7_9ACTN|nr:aldo/keto reductase [Catenuloplanes nepalensis]MDP9794155.1 diketogulonate reductase-like aldo/keto reductase [Catenuloplanes nepalensis]
MTQEDTPVRRRSVFKAGGVAFAASLGAGGALTESAAAGAVAGGPAASDLITRPVPRTGQRLPAVGLGTFMTFDTLPGAGRDHVREVLRRHWAGGGRVVDTSALYGASEANLGAAARQLGITERLFVANKVWATGEHLWDDSHAEHSLARSRRRLARQRPLDLLQVHSLVNVDVMVPLLHAWKQEGRIGHLGVTHHEAAYLPALTSWIRRGELDFVQVHYSMAFRGPERELLPAAAGEGTAVLVNMALEKGRLHQLVAGRPLPGFAAGLGITSWAQFFLKWVLGHPAVTCVLPATSRPEHVTDNLAAMRGPLPDAATRDRMSEYMATVPGFHEVSRAPWYPGRSYPGLVARSQAAIRARSPWWAPGPSA